MRKIFLSIIISLLVSYTGSNYLDHTIKENWEMNLNYEHISRELNVDYEMAIDITGSNSENKFLKYVDVLNFKISTPGKPNPCSKARSSSKIPNIIVTQSKAAVQIVMSHQNKNLILDCENFIDNEMDTFATNSKLLLSNILEFQKSNNAAIEPRREWNQKKIYDLLFQEILRQQEKKDLVSDDIKSLATSLMLLDMVSPKISDSLDVFANRTKINQLEIVRKSFRYLSREKTNKSALNLSLFIITFSILLFIFHFNQLKFSNIKMKKIVKLLLK